MAHLTTPPKVAILQLVKDPTIDTPRRVPRQARSRQRYDDIVDAAAALFAAEGFDGTTIDAIAQAAGTSVGSLYQFFGDKTDIFGVIMTRSFARVEALFETLHSVDIASVPWETHVDRIVDGFVALYRSDNYLRTRARNPHVYLKFEDADMTFNRLLAKQATQVVAAYAPHLKPARCRIIATTIQWTLLSLLTYSETESTRFANAMTKETKALLHSYLAEALA